MCRLPTLRLLQIDASEYRTASPPTAAPKATNQHQLQGAKAWSRLNSHPSITPSPLRPRCPASALHLPHPSPSTARLLPSLPSSAIDSPRQLRIDDDDDAARLRYILYTLDARKRIHTMAGVKSALPSHLKPAHDGGEDNGFERRHHGKTRSHMASQPPLLWLSPVSLPSSHPSILAPSLAHGMALHFTSPHRACWPCTTRKSPRGNGLHTPSPTRKLLPLLCSLGQNPSTPGLLTPVAVQQLRLSLQGVAHAPGTRQAGSQDRRRCCSRYRPRQFTVVCLLAQP
ncbi:Uncharacterized protein TPAR_08553 [Tolypocladium paradoxum]|uniref:Uncharacterized protein n=1 Tax=Tolypocladium paradoxum TaxID=94208 RepID=A0A2S4KM45_9HYPO|nr:Uncharacterized protein TPAR_08553 [Tolypocladium paradoxum]